MRASPWSRVLKKTYATAALSRTRTKLTINKQKQLSRSTSTSFKTLTSISSSGPQASLVSPYNTLDYIESSSLEYSFDD